MKISGTYLPQKWKEEIIEIIENRLKSSRTSAEFAFSGDIKGLAKVEYLMFYTHFDTTDSHQAKATYVGLMTIIGELKGKSGSFSMTDNGVYDSNGARSSLEIIPGSGTGELQNIRGSGTYQADQKGCFWSLDVAFASAPI